MGFEFKEKPTIEICGKNYECDITNCDLISSVAEDFPRIVLCAQDLERDQKDLAKAVKNSDTDKIKELGDKSVNDNLALLKTCKDFICGCIGTSEYEEIFSKRKPNSAEHLDLCVHIFGFIMGGREEIVKEYLDLPENNVVG